MIRVYGKQKDDCLTTATASLLELPYEEVPYFGDGFDDDKKPPGYWTKPYRKWLGLYGLEYHRWDDYNVPSLADLAANKDNDFGYFPDGYYIGIVMTPAQLLHQRDLGHAVVMRGRHLAHDGSRLVERKSTRWHMIGWMIITPFDPAAGAKAFYEARVEADRAKTKAGFKKENAKLKA